MADLWRAAWPRFILTGGAPEAKEAAAAAVFSKVSVNSCRLGRSRPSCTQRSGTGAGFFSPTAPRRRISLFIRRPFPSHAPYRTDSWYIKRVNLSSLSLLVVRHSISGPAACTKAVSQIGIKKFIAHPQSATRYD